MFMTIKEAADEPSWIDDADSPGDSKESSDERWSGSIRLHSTETGASSLIQWNIVD